MLDMQTFSGCKQVCSVGMNTNKGIAVFRLGMNFGMNAKID
jgi:hypothetical protein